MVKQAVDQI
jgi:hypothetical protein